jgi:hypothetical protein
VVEHGLLKYPGAATFWIQPKHFPIWLLALDQSVVHTIHLMGGVDAKSFLQEMRSRDCDLTLLNLVIGQIGLGKVRFFNLPWPTPIHSEDLILISGSIDYIRHHSNLATKPTMVLCDIHI